MTDGEIAQVLGTTDVVAPAASSSALASDEQLLIARAQAGDPRALREIHDAYQGQVRAHLHRLLGPDSEIDDLVQVIFVRAFTAIKRFRGGSTLATWLYRITANTTSNLLRQRYRRNRLKAAVQWFNQGRRAEVQGPTLDARRQAHSLLEHLHPDLRHVFVLYHHEGLTLQEIAEILEKPISTIGDRLSRARKRLRELVESE